MKNFEYAIPDSIEKALEYLNAEKSHLKAGGIDLVDMMKEGIIEPKRLVNIRALKALKFIREDGDGNLGIGPAVTLNDLADDGKIKEKFNALAQAAGGVASPQIRNTATLGGNILQRPRCWYFRSSDFHCSRKGGDTCFALDGENQYHAIFANSDGCAIVHPSGTAVALMALDARIIISDGNDEREVKIEEFFITPDTDIGKENILKPNEIITAIIIPSALREHQSFYFKHKEKATFDWPLADVAVAMKLDSKSCQDVRIILGAAAPVPWRSKDAEAILLGKKIDKNVIKKAAEAAVANAEPLDLNAYKIPLFKTIIYRSICWTVGIDPMT